MLGDGDGGWRGYVRGGEGALTRGEDGHLISCGIPCIAPLSQVERGRGVGPHAAAERCGRAVPERQRREHIGGEGGGG